MSEKIVVYTAIFGDKDDLKEPIRSAIEHDVDYVCFTDNSQMKSDVYDVRYIGDSGFECKRMAAKQYKIKPHEFFPHHDLSIWMDGSFRIIKPIRQLAEKALEFRDLCFVRHWDHQCTYKEAKAYWDGNRPCREKVMHQLAVYREDGLPQNAGMAIGGFIIRRHHADIVREWMNRWWAEICMHTFQDQISLGYLLWKQPIEYCEIDRNVMYDFVRFYKHVQYERGDNRIGKRRKATDFVSKAEEDCG